MGNTANSEQEASRGFWFDGYAGGTWRGITLAAVGVLLAGLIGVRVGQTMKATAPPKTASTGRATSAAAVPKPVLASVLEVSRIGTTAPGAKLLTLPKTVHAKTWAIGGKPAILYVGAEFCPFCAAERWAMVIALSRFGTFSNLHLMRSSATDYAPNTPTFTFYGSRYQSAYVDFEPVELTTNKANASGNYPPLQKPTAFQSSLLNKYDAPPYVPSQSAGDIPFVDIANHYLQVGSAFDPTLLDGRSWQAIANAAVIAAKTGQTTGVGAQIVRAANALTRAICETDGGKPVAVCTAKGVVSALSGVKK